MYIYHMTNSSHVIGHFLRTLRCVSYVHCVAIIRLETALYLLSHRACITLKQIPNYAA